MTSNMKTYLLDIKMKFSLKITLIMKTTSNMKITININKLGLSCAKLSTAIAS